MEQFSLDKWLENPSREVVTKDGRPVRIICWDRNTTYWKIIALVTSPDGSTENPYTYDVNGNQSDGCLHDHRNDLFFADEETETIELPFGAKDSELIKDEYFIPEGCKAKIEGNKVIIERIKREDELTEFEKEVKDLINSCCNEIEEADITNELVKEAASNLLDLARKELQPEFDKEMDKMLAETDKIVYQKGQQDALKSLPKWKKMPNGIQGNAYSIPTYLVRVSNGHYFTTPCLSWDKDSMYIELSELENLPKEE